MQRQALAQRGLPTRSRGDAKLVELLERAWRAADGNADELTHGFHTYPARMHPLLARECLKAHDGSVLDPFSGSGTVLVEAMLAGRHCVGIDLNPIAIRIAEAKTTRMDEDARQVFAETVQLVADKSEARVRARIPVRAPLGRLEASWYEGHTLKELAGLREEILDVQDEPVRRLLEMVLSSILVKFSLQRADTAERAVPKRIRKGLPTEFFVRRGHELLERWAHLESQLPKGAPSPRIRLGDARELSRVLPKGFKADLVLTSPPYGGTYDYVDHHARRYPWLGIDPRTFGKGEIGSRRDSQDQGAVDRWDRDMGASLRAMSGGMSDQGLAILLMGDGLVDGREVPADEQIERLAPDAGLKLVAVASQRRPDWQGGAARAEHLLALQKTGEPRERRPQSSGTRTPATGPRKRPKR